MSDHDPRRLRALRDTSLGMLDDLSDTALRRQSHPALSPMLWHVGHVFFVESYWLAERVFGDRRATDPWRELYFPETAPKAGRGARLPTPDELRAWARQTSAENDRHWQQSVDHAHPLLTGGYLSWFVRQHYAQHLETMRLAASRLARAETPPIPAAISPAPPDDDRVSIPAGEVTLGTDTIDAYDNEQPAWTIAVPAFSIARHPVSNAAWLGFMQADGYRRASLWDAEGWAWRCDHDVTHPEHWLALGNDAWHIPALDDTPLAAQPVHGIGWYEARAFARYADARLPREREWERARRAGRLDHLHRVWEWCDDAFAPYPGFRAFPYAGYSTPWFDGAHFVARGGSIHTEPEIRRPGFRNFYPPTHRHVFAGLRLAW